MHDSIDSLLQNQFGFLGLSVDSAGPVAVSSRIRLARNLRDFNFPVAAGESERVNLRDLVARAVGRSGILGSDYRRFDMEELSDVEKSFLLERHLASCDLFDRPEGAALLVDANEGIAVMINEEDHLRLQVLAPGFHLENLWAKIDHLDSLLNRELDFAFDEKLGFLTSCPTNVGTGMRASVMLHLAGLSLAGEIPALERAMARLDFTVRGRHGEGTEDDGGIFQLSNQSTLGESEAEIIDRLSGVVAQVIAQEQRTRQLLLEKRQYDILDHVGRAYGLLRHSYKLTQAEALRHLSAVRMGVDFGLFSNLTLGLVDELMFTVGDGHLQKQIGRRLEEQERNIMRATMIRDRLRQRV
ncbi:MAG: protein arginine kinase [Victivallaceae bacterium]|nr:protein arginine kinase [Victivallaceae bacterium]